ncbi:hypothetical protein BH10PLA1_BH10PLA1_19100 [soil metagenome]
MKVTDVWGKGNMVKALNILDASAVDLILDGASRAGTSSYSAPDQAVADRLPGVENVLSLLNSWEAKEPGADLLERTLAHIGLASQRPSDSAASDQFRHNV